MKLLRPNCRHAFTLVEMLVASTISLIILLVLTQLLGTMLDTWKKGGERAEIRSNARLAIDLLGRELAAAFVDLELGWQLLPALDGVNPNNPELKILTRKSPNNPDKSSLYRVSYRLGWAAYTLNSNIAYNDRFRINHEKDYDTPVLIRTASSNISTVFNAISPRTAQSWVNEWPDPLDPLHHSNGSIEAVVDHVLGWKIEILKWNQTGGNFDIFPADNTAANNFGRLRTSEEDFRVVRVTLAIIGSKSMPILRTLPNFSTVRERADLFTLQETNAAPADPTEHFLRQNLRLITSTYRLQSKTP